MIVAGVKSIARDFEKILGPFVNYIRIGESG
jgi:hypothetical protein